MFFKIIKTPHTEGAEDLERHIKLNRDIIIGLKNKENSKLLSKMRNVSTSEKLKQKTSREFKTVSSTLREMGDNHNGFLFNLPQTKSDKSTIFLVVDKLSRRAHFVPLRSPNVNAKDIA